VIQVVKGLPSKYEALSSNPSLNTHKKKDLEFKVSLGYIERPCLKQNKIPQCEFHIDRYLEITYSTLDL
jgi:hypothetical protein